MSKLKLSDEEIQTKRQELLEKAVNIITQISEMSPHLLGKDGEEFTQFVGYVKDLTDVFYGFNRYNVPAHVVDEHKTDVSQVVYKSGAHKVVCDVVTSRLSTRNFVTQDEVSVSQMWTLMGGLVSYSRSDDVIDYMTEDSGFLPALVHTLDAGHTPHLDKVLSEEQSSILSRCMTIISNCAMNEKNIPAIRKEGTVNVVLPYLDSHEGKIQLKSLATLAKLVDEEEAKDLLTNHVTIFTLLIQRLDKAWHSSTHYEDWGWPVDGLILTIQKLARNDINKEVLVDQGCLPILVKILDSSFDEEVTASLEALWLLSFEKDNKEKMVKERHLVRRVWRKYSHVSSTDKIKKSSYGILWSLIDQLEQGEKLKYVGIATKIELQKLKADMKPKEESQQQGQGESSDGDSFKGHVMLSYQWGHQKTIRQICQKLKDAGVPVWIDVDFMEGSTLETMAKAVEKCSIFIMAISQGYKESPNTRLEAAYAQKLNKPIIPLMMERDYKPDGWLGILLGTETYYEFSDKYPFDNKMSELLKAVKSKMGQGISTETKIKPQTSSLVAQSGQQGDTVTLTQAQLQTLIDTKIQEQAESDRKTKDDRQTLEDIHADHQTDRSPQEKKGESNVTVICSIL